MPRTRFEKISDRMVVPVVLGAVLCSFFIQRADTISRDRDARDALVAGCVRTSPRAAVAAAWAFDAARVRRASGDSAAADRYDAYARGIVASLAAPKGAAAGDPALADVQLSRDAAGKSVFVLTPHARALIQAGCERVYPKP